MKNNLTSYSQTEESLGEPQAYGILGLLTSGASTVIKSTLESVL